MFTCLDAVFCELVKNNSSRLTLQLGGVQTLKEGKPMRVLILFSLFLLILSSTACNRVPSPIPQATTAKLTLTLIPIRSTEWGNGSVRLAPAPKSGNTTCKLVGEQSTTCAEDFTLGQEVTLLFVPNETSNVQSTSGCDVTKCEGCPPRATTCRLTMN